MDTTELIRYVDDLMRRAIASDLKIRRKDLVSSPELQERVEHFLITVKAISATPTNDDAVDALVGLVKKPASRASLAADVTTAYEKLYLEIAGFERLLEMLKLKMGPAVIWDFLRTRVPIGAEFDDEWLASADAWILRGKVIHVPLGQATIYSL